MRKYVVNYGMNQSGKTKSRNAKQHARDYGCGVEVYRVYVNTKTYIDRYGRELYETPYKNLVSKAVVSPEFGVCNVSF